MASLLADVLARPSRAMERLAGPGSALGASASIFALSLAANVAFQALKPPDFPAAEAAGSGFEVSGDWLFWAKVQAYNLPLTGAWIALAAFFVRILGRGRLLSRVLLCACALALPLGLVLADQQGSLPRPALAAAWAAIALAVAWVVRPLPGEFWRPLVSLFLSLNAVSLASTALLAGAIGLRLEAAYHAVEMIALFWTLGLAAYGVGRLLRLKTARAFLAVFLSALGQILVLYGLHRLGLVPKDVLKGLMSV